MSQIWLRTVACRPPIQKINSQELGILGEWHEVYSTYISAQVAHSGRVFRSGVSRLLYDSQLSQIIREEGELSPLERTRNYSGSQISETYDPHTAALRFSWPLVVSCGVVSVCTYHCLEGGWNGLLHKWRYSPPNMTPEEGKLQE